MESIRDCYAVILNNAELRQGLIREADRAPGSDRAGNTTKLLRRWFALTLHGLASRVDPALGTLDLRLAAASGTAAIWLMTDS